MAKKVVCVKETNLEVTVLKTYEVLDEDSVSEKIKIFDDQGKVVWVDVDCFRLQ